MAREIYCWRCRVEMPMLDEDEWARIGPLLSGAPDPSKREAALDLYEEMTGLRETNINAIWHHRINDYGPPCRECGKPLRTDRASFCAACGALRDASVASGEHSVIQETDTGTTQRLFVRAWKCVSQFKPPLGVAVVLCFTLYVAGQALG